jgi:hypothetical protein
MSPFGKPVVSEVFFNPASENVTKSDLLSWADGEDLEMEACTP